MFDVNQKQLPVKIEGLLTLNDALTLDREQVKELHKKYLNSALTTMLGLINFDRQFTKAQGVSVWDSTGREYLDFLGAYGAMNIGHNHPKVIAALERVKELPNLLQSSLGTLAGALASNLAKITPGNLSHSFFCNSGAEAVEGALKLARIATGRKEFVYCMDSFHGKTFGALSITGRKKYQQPFLPLLSGCTCIPYGDTKALHLYLKNEQVAAFIVEPIQGEGGIILPPLGYLTEARRLCSKYGTLLIIDEVQTGFGRTGNMFACEHEEILPDVICLAKSLGGGIMPIGAYVTTDETWKKAYGSIEKCILHTSTFGGNSLAAAAAITTIEVIYEENLIVQAREKGKYLRDKLLKLKEKYPHILKDVRGRGLLIGLEFHQPKDSLSNKFSLGFIKKLSDDFLGSLIAGELLNKYGIITAYTLNNPNVIRLEPPLIVTYNQLDTVLNALEEILAAHKDFLSVAVSTAKTTIKSIITKK